MHLHAVILEGINLLREREREYIKREFSRCKIFITLNHITINSIWCTGEISHNYTHEPHFKNSAQVFQSVIYAHRAVIVSYKFLLYLALASLPNLILISLCLAAVALLSVSCTLQHCSASEPWHLVFSVSKKNLLFFFFLNVTSYLTANYKMVNHSPIILLSFLIVLSTICNYLNRDHTLPFCCLNSQPQEQILACNGLSIFHWMN